VNRISDSFSNGMVSASASAPVERRDRSFLSNFTFPFGQFRWPRLAHTLSPALKAMAGLGPRVRGQQRWSAFETRP
jgi:hypothetical protein